KKERNRKSPFPLFHHPPVAPFMTLVRSSSTRKGIRFGLGVVAALILSACGSQLQVSQAELEQAAGAATKAAVAATPRATAAAAATPRAVPVQNPFLFVTPVPLNGRPFASRVSPFANHLAVVNAVPRGGDLMIRYPDGTLRNLTREAGYG